MVSLVWFGNQDVIRFERDWLYSTGFSSPNGVNADIGSEQIAQPKQWLAGRKVFSASDSEVEVKMRFWFGKMIPKLNIIRIDFAKLKLLLIKEWIAGYDPVKKRIF